MFFIVFFYCLCQYLARDNYWFIYFIFLFYIWQRNEAVNGCTEIKIHFCLYHLNLVRKRNVLCARNIHCTSSILVKIMDLIQLFFCMLTLKALVELNITNCYGNGQRVSLNQTSCSCARVVYYTSSILVKITLKSALLPHNTANTQSPDITECNRLSW